MSEANPHMHTPSSHAHMHMLIGLIHCGAFVNGSSPMHADDIVEQSVLDVGFDYRVTHLTLLRLIPGVWRICCMLRCVCNSICSYVCVNVRF